MYNFLSRNGLALAFGLGFFIIIVYYLIVFSGAEAFGNLPEEEQPGSSLFDFGLYASYILFGLAVLLSIAFPVVYALTHPKTAIYSGIGILALVVIIIVAMVISPEPIVGDSEAVRASINNFEPDQSKHAWISKYVSTGLNTAMLTGAVAVILLLLSELRNFFK